MSLLQKINGLGLAVGAIFTVTLAPIIVVIAASFSDTNYTTFPPRGITLKWYWAAANNPSFVDAMILSIWLAALIGIVSTILGILIGLAVVRYEFFGRDAVIALFLAPLMLPGVVLGIALLQFYSVTSLSNSILGLMFGHIVVTTPYAARLIISTLTGFDRNLEVAARGLGSSPARAFYTVTLPVLKSGIISAGIFAFITSFDNVTVSVFLATPTMVTLPIKIFNYLQYQNDPLIAAVSTIQILIAAGLAVILDRVVGLNAVGKGGSN